jgi:hypothetical protein
VLTDSSSVTRSAGPKAPRSSTSGSGSHWPT